MRSGVVQPTASRLPGAACLRVGCLAKIPSGCKINLVVKSGAVLEDDLRLARWDSVTRNRHECKSKRVAKGLLAHLSRSSSSTGGCPRSLAVLGTGETPDLNWQEESPRSGRIGRVKRPRTRERGPAPAGPAILLPAPQSLAPLPLFFVSVPSSPLDLAEE